jgi:hypothetical protein
MEGLWPSSFVPSLQLEKPMEKEEVNSPEIRTVGVVESLEDNHHMA